MTAGAAAGRPAPAAAVAPPTFAEALRFWLKLGCISFGGPAGQIALLHAELVERRRWISERRFLHALNYCLLLPGPEAQQLATYIGWLLHGTRGGIAAGVLFVLPSLAILIVLSWLYVVFSQTAVVTGVLWGIRPAVMAIVVAAAWRIGRRTLHDGWLVAIALASFVAIAWLQVAFPWVLLVAAGIGAAGARLAPDRFRATAAHSGAPAGLAPALIDDATPAPPHARFTRPRMYRQLASGIGLWAAALAVLALVDGRAGTLVQMAWFFTKAALLTFGGAYAVLPYVAQAAVFEHGWLTAAQMIDGLALGETTPGPLIMVVAFVAFVGGWTQPVFGLDQLLAGAVAAACVATFFTFLPSFLFILVGGPLVEATHDDLKLTAPLAAISAAVVGVIAHLGLFFAVHVLWPAGRGGPFAWGAAALGLLAAVALMRWNVGVVKVIAACAAAGLLRAWTTG